MPFTPLSEEVNPAPKGFTPLSAEKQGFTPIEPEGSSVLDNAKNAFIGAVKDLSHILPPQLQPLDTVRRMAEENIRAEQAGQTSAVSPEGLTADVNAASMGLAMAKQGIEHVINRPSTQPTMEDFFKEEELMKQGLSEADAKAKVAAEREAKAAPFDAQARGQALGTQQAVQDVLPKNPTETQRHMQNAALSLGVSGPGVVAGMVTGNPAVGIALGSAPQYPLAYEQAIADGADHNTASLSATVQTGLEAAWEYAPMETLVSAFGKQEVGKKAFEYLAKEIGGEIGATATQDLAQKLIEHPEADWGDWRTQTLKDVIDTAIETPIQGGVHIAVAHALERKPEEIKPVMQELTDAAKSGNADEVAVAQDKIQHELDAINADANVLNESLIPPKAFKVETELSPDREAAANSIEPMSDEELKTAIATMPPRPVAPEVINDGTQSVGANEVLDNRDAQLGNTKKVIANAENYEPNPNDLTPRAERQILMGDPSIVGQQLGSVKLPYGVTTVGEPSDAFTRDYTQAIHDLYSSLAEQFTPDAKIILAPQTIGNRNAIGMTQRLASGEYVVVPGQARSVGLGADSLNPENFNAHTRAKLLDNAHHEFGHVLAMQEFMRGVDPAVQIQFEQQQRTGVISPDVLAHLSPEAQALATEYMQLRQELKTKNAAWFQSEWMSPSLAVQRQLIRDVGGYENMNAESFVKRLVARGNPEVAKLDRKLKGSLSQEERVAVNKQRDALLSALAEDYLSFHEFMAEKMARYAHEKNTQLPDSTQKILGAGRGYVKSEENVRTNLLNSTLENIQQSLRNLFIALKRGVKLASGQVYRIRAGTTFEQWLGSLSRLRQLEGARTSGELLQGEVKKTEAKKAELPQEAQTEEVRLLRKTVTFSAFSPQQKTELYALIRRNELHTARERMLDFLKAKVKFQLEPSEFTLSDEQNKLLNLWTQQGIKSPQFKAFFGDWEQGQGSKVVAADGKPLVVFHATNKDFSAFTIGDAGFHFGDLMAAQARMTLQSPAAIRNEDTRKFHHSISTFDLTQAGEREAQIPNDVARKGNTWLNRRQEDWHIMPMYLNIRNPLVLSEDRWTGIWNEPVMMANLLRDMNVLTLPELSVVWKEQQRFMKENEITSLNIRRGQVTPAQVHQMFGFLREILKKKGYDGIQYANYVEGGTSWVAFDSNQIKSASGNYSFSTSPQVHMQTDVDLTKPELLEIDTLAKTIDKYENMGLTGRALRVLARSQWYTMQLQQLAWIHPEFSFLEMADSAAKLYTAMKSRLQATGEATAQKWKRLGKEWDAKLSRALEAEAESGAHWTLLENKNGQWVHTVTQDTLEKLKVHGLTLDTPGGKAAIEIFAENKNVLLQQLLAAQVTLARRLGMQNMGDAEFTMQLNELKKEFSNLRKIPFLPRGDYGSWGIVITEQKGLERKVIFRQMFESRGDLDKARALAEKNLKPGQKIRTVTKLADEQKPLLALPLEYADKAAEAMGMTQEQKDLMFDLMHPVKKEKLTEPYMRALEKIGGGNKDRMRNFADFVWHNSTAIARAEAIPALNRAKHAGTEMFNAVDTAQGMEASARNRLLDDIKRAQLYLDKTVGYMLSPPNEWYGARSFVAILYLWGSVKTAALNLVGLSTSISALSSQYGDVKGFSALAKAHKQLAMLTTQGKADPFATSLYDRALSEGFLVQNYAAHLAGAATASTSKRLVNRSRWTADVGNVVGRVADAGMVPFSLAEQYTRRITFLAVANALEMEAKEKGKGLNADAIYSEAVKQTDLLQNSYSLANRPVVMRGTGPIGALAPLVTIFMSFAGHFTFNAAGGYTLGAERRAGFNLQSTPKSYISNTKRLLLMLLVLGGYEALPGAENLLDILDWLFLQMGGGKTARQELREGIQAIPEIPGASWANDPRWWGKGLGGDLWGFDVSKSLGIGRIIPGTDIPASTPQSADEAIGKFATEFGGVAGNLGHWAIQTALDLQNGNPIQKDMMRFPGVVGLEASAYDWSQNGVKGSHGETIYEPTNKDIVGKALGFTPSALSEKREVINAQREAFNFWTKQRELLQKHYNIARDADDREAIADAEKAIEDFNDKVLDSRMKIKAWQRNQSYRQHLKQQQQLESGNFGKRVQNLGEDVAASFEDGGEEEAP